MASMTFDLPLPFGPTTDVKFCEVASCVRSTRDPGAKQLWQ